MLQAVVKMRRVFIYSAALMAVLALAPSESRAQDSPSGQPPEAASATAKAEAPVPEKPASAEKVKPVPSPSFVEYKGVKLGMAADDVRRSLSGLKDKSKAQDFFAFSDRETAQIFYDAGGKVTAVAVTYHLTKGNAPTPEAVLGEKVEAKADGSIYEMRRYTEAGLWVSYSRTAGDSPLVTVTMQKID